MAKKVFVEKAKRFLKNVLQEPELREYVIRELSTHFADKEKTEDNLEKLYREVVRIGDELVRLREEQEKGWQEQSALWQEQNRRWEVQERRWEEQQKINRELIEEIKKLHRKYDTGTDAQGARWGLRAESSFREAIKGILEEDFPVKVERYLAYDEEGEVFGKPHQIELDLIIKNGKTILAEIKSSMSKSDVFVLKRTVDFYKKKEGRELDRVLVIFPMVDSKAMELAEEYGFEAYSYPEDVEGLNEKQ
ncbi:MAG: PD-(D/E)XK nuclease family protein [Aquificaceae bacterium]|jgi:hypothetical protein|uniref:PD-(D/E)XK nuclease family protein n=1 Tax=Hydrogenobacter sp. Uz 6-8 TaxID=3384828 RepID=UPI000F22BF42|nr:MAG: DUF3782 domain-containing protein [Aquificota bacterium]